MGSGRAAHEVLAAVYGREGYITTYKRSMINNIAFVIFDTSTEKSRTVGVSPRSSRLLYYPCAESLNLNLILDCGRVAAVDRNSRLGRPTRESRSGSPTSSP